MATNYRPIRPLGAYEQLAMMRLVHPRFQSTVHKGLLVCRGSIRPTALNATYKVRLEYRVWDVPRVFVIEPALRERKPGERIPHTYTDRGPRPCLYLPGSHEWRTDKRVADTIVPWLSEWLFYYEVWLVTGEWLGGGVHPGASGSGRHRSEAA
jgi:hypothetical protein